MINLIKARHFRSTPGVKFDDISVPGSNGLDLVEHTGPSVSPPMTKRGRKQWYVHRHQDDYNRCIRGHRLFELFNPFWKDPYWFVMLDEEAGALHIPAGCLHRSYSGNDGSVLLNHAVRDIYYNEETEFVPVTNWTHNFCQVRYHNCTLLIVEHFIEYGEILQ